MARAGGSVSVDQVQPTDHLITACNEGPEENEREAVMENALGPCLGLRGVVVRENSEGVSLRLRLKAWEGASWPRSVQREESSRRRNNVRERPSGKDLGVSEALNGGQWAGTRRAGGRMS